MAGSGLGCWRQCAEPLTILCYCGTSNLTQNIVVQIFNELRIFCFGACLWSPFFQIVCTYFAFSVQLCGATRVVLLSRIDNGLFI